MIPARPHEDAVADVARWREGGCLSASATFSVLRCPELYSRLVAQGVGPTPEEGCAAATKPHPRRGVGLQR